MLQIEQFTAILDNIADIVYVRDLDHRYLFVNRRFEEIFEIKREALIGNFGEKLFSAEVRAVWQENDREVYALNKEMKFEEFAPHPDGLHNYISHKFPLYDTAGQPYALCGISTDITVQKKAEAENYKYIELLNFKAEVLGQLSTAIVALDNDYRIIYWNSSSEKMFGFSPEEALGRLRSELYQYEWLNSGDAEASAQALETEGHWQGRTYIILHNGRKIIAELAVSVLRDAEDNQTGFMGVIRDVSEQHQSYQQLEEKVAERTRELLTLLEISRDMSKTAGLNFLSQQLISHLKDLVAYTGVTIFRYEDKKLVLLETSSPLSPEKSQKFNHLLEQTNLLQKALQTLQPLVVPDLWQEAEIINSCERPLKIDLKTKYSFARSFLAVPLAVENRLVGLISITHNEPAYYTAHHIELVVALARQAAIAFENSYLFEQGQKLAALEERQRLARELHDSTSQVLYSAMLGADTALTLLNRKNYAALQNPLEHVLNLTKSGLSEMRSLIFELRPETLEREGLYYALTNQLQTLKNRYGFEVDFVGSSQELAISLELKETLYRVSREALHNVVKHSNATKVLLALELNGLSLTLMIQDNGIGFEVNRDYTGHLGLRSMRERTEQQQGIFSIESSAGNGTLVQARFNLKTLL
jgi:PAS domain S-box-containing protein